MVASRAGGRRLVVASLVLLVVLLGLAPAARQEGVGFSMGVACGDVAADSVVLWTRPDRPTALEVEIDDRPDFATARRVGPLEARPADDLTVHAVVDGLAAGMRYHYRFQATDGARLTGTSEPGTCTTAYAPDQAAPLTFAFSGDADWIWRPFPLLRVLNRESLDFFVFLGDLIYEWTDDAADFAARPVAETLDEYRAVYRRTRAPRAEAPALAALRDTYARFGQYSVFDNHEPGLSRADPTAPPYTQGGGPAGDGVHAYMNQTPGFVDRIRAYADYQPIRARHVDGTGAPRLDGTGRYYYAQQWGRDAVLIVADDRSYRDAELASADDPAADSPDRTMRRSSAPMAPRASGSPRRSPATTASPTPS